MPPSFRNLFSSGDGNARSSSEARSSSDEGSQGGAPGAAKGQVFLISEILPYIPSAIVARSGIPMELSLSVPLPENGSREVRLSVLHHLCPALFAAEITPMNDLAITLPPRIGMKADPVPRQGNLWERPLLQKTPDSSSTPAAPTGPAANPFRPRRSVTETCMSGGGTLFTRKAAEDADLPAPQTPASLGGEPQATWGSLFLDKVREPAAESPRLSSAPAVEKIETPTQAAKPVNAETPSLAPLMAIPKLLPLAPVAVNLESPPLAPVMVNPAPLAPRAVEKVPSHVFERLDEDSDEAVMPVPVSAPNPWAAAEALRPVTTEQSTPGGATSNRFGQASKHTESGLIFRAMFGTEDDFDLDRLAQALLVQVGIDSVVLSLPPHLAEASVDSAEKLGGKALELIEATRSLGRLVGMDNDAFSFQADRGFISLFTHGQQSIVVRHAEARLSPGLRERLLLSVRNLESLVG